MSNKLGCDTTNSPAIMLAGKSAGGFGMKSLADYKEIFETTATIQHLKKNTIATATIEAAVRAKSNTITAWKKACQKQGLQVNTKSLTEKKIWKIMPLQKNDIQVLKASDIWYLSSMSTQKRILSQEELVTRTIAPLPKRIWKKIAQKICQPNSTSLKY